MSREDEIRARLDAATPGPWYWRNTQAVYLFGARSKVVMAFRRMGMSDAQPQFRRDDGLLYDAGKENINAFHDAALIANAPGDLAYLLAKVARCEALADEWQKEAAASERGLALTSLEHGHNGALRACSANLRALLDGIAFGDALKDDR